MVTEYSIPRIVLTSGEPAGIGPDIIIKSILQPINAEIVIIADPELLESRAKKLGLSLILHEYDSETPPGKQDIKKIKCIPVKLQTECIAGKPDIKNARYILQTLEVACKGCLDRKFSAMVTAPVDKSIINRAGIPFTGHTEFLAQCCDVSFPVMMLANKNLRIALVTTHIPLSKVCNSITAENVAKTIEITSNELINRFGIEKPHLLICGLNPHAGEKGYLGKEEIEIISPVINKLKSKGFKLTGPVPADTAFTPKMLENVDAVISMYHDQGLPVIKSSGFGETVNITLGLPIIRTSVDHGTAPDLAATGQSDESSMLAAINLAINLSITSGISDTYKAVKSLTVNE